MADGPGTEAHTPPRSNVTFDPHRHAALWEANVEHGGLLRRNASQAQPGRMSKKKRMSLRGTEPCLGLG